MAARLLARVAKKVEIERGERKVAPMRSRRANS